MQNTTSILDAALGYAGGGWQVFPVIQGTKLPATTHGFNDASTDFGTLSEWFTGRNKNLGIATGEKSGLVVIDVDTYKGADLSPLEHELGQLPKTREARTRAGGTHYLYKYPAGRVIGSSNSQIAPNIDIKANGGYVVAPPSYVKADEKGPAGYYAWENDLPLAELPEPWIDRLESMSNKKLRSATVAGTKGNLSAIADSVYRPPGRVESGGRNSEVLAYVGHLRGKGMSESLILDAAHDFNRARCVPALDDDEVTDIVSRYASPQPDSCDGWPDPTPIDAPLPEVKPFGFAMLPDSCSPFVQDCAELMQCPPEYLAVPLMVSLAAVIGNRFAIAPKRLDSSWLVAPVFWGGVVGKPGLMKSPAVSAATKPLSILETEMADMFEKKRGEYEIAKITYAIALEKAKKSIKSGEGASLPPEPDEPQPERLIVNDSTVQKLGEILRWSPSGVLVIRDEMTSLLEMLSADGQEGARGFYLEGWNGVDSFRVDRVGRGSFIIPKLALWLLGGIQPGKLVPYVRQATQGGRGDDGLLQRFQLLVWPDTPKDWKNIDRPQNLEALRVVENLCRYLRNLTPAAVGATVDPMGNRPAYLHFTSEAQEVFDAWRVKLETALRTEGRHPALESHLAKYRSLIPALALVIHLADHGTGPVTLEALKKGILWHNYLWSHARRVYACVTNGGGFAAKALADKIKQGKLVGGFTAREVLRHGWSNLNTPDDVRSALEWLIDAGWVNAKTRTTEHGGRPTLSYILNPKVKDLP